MEGQDTMTIFIKNPNGQRLQIDGVAANETIESLKNKVFKKTMFPVAKQTLSYAGRRLENGHTVSEYYMDEGCTVHCTIENASNDAA